jgi:hypothetical protein
MVGTLGSIMQRKVTEAFSVRKHKHENTPGMPDIYFEVLQPKSRGRDQDEWCFEVTNAESWGVPVELDSNGRVTETPSQKEMKAIRECDAAFKGYNWTSSGAGYTDLDKYLTRLGITSNRQKKDLFDLGLEKGIIFKTDNKRYYYNGMRDIHPDQPEGLPFDQPDSNSDAPF